MCKREYSGFCLLCACSCHVDPYCRISFSHHYVKSVILPETIMPTWDQTLIMDKIDLYGDMKVVAETPPDLVIELFDQDVIVSCSACSGFFLSILRKFRCPKHLPTLSMVICRKKRVISLSRACSICVQPRPKIEMDKRTSCCLMWPTRINTAI